MLFYIGGSPFLKKYTLKYIRVKTCHTCNLLWKWLENSNILRKREWWWSIFHKCYHLGNSETDIWEFFILFLQLSWSLKFFQSKKVKKTKWIHTYPEIIMWTGLHPWPQFGGSRTHWVVCSGMSKEPLAEEGFCRSGKDHLSPQLCHLAGGLGPVIQPSWASASPPWMDINNTYSVKIS